jgi:hypothetical protein
MESVVRPGAILGYLGKGGLLEVERFMKDLNEQHMV